MAYVEKFSNAERKHIDYKEGDYFRVKLGKNKYTYGRILLDVDKRTKNKTLSYWEILMGKTLIVEIFHILSNNPYWEKYKYYNDRDLRSPKNREILIKILKDFNLDNLIDLYND